MSNAPDTITIQFAVSLDEAAEMPRGKREGWLGKLAEEQLAEVVPPRPPLNLHDNPWKPYTRESIAEAFQEWARLHDGKAPTRADWTNARDPERRWPRCGEAFVRAVRCLAEEEGIITYRTAPHKNDHLEQARCYGLVGTDFKPYCEDCFHGSGCRPPEMSPWRYAVEIIGGLSLRTGGDFQATRSRLSEYGRNRQMVTAGAHDVKPRYVR